MAMVTLELTEDEAELIKKGLEIVSEMDDDHHDLCWEIIERIDNSL